MAKALNMVTIPSGDLKGTAIDSFEMSENLITQGQWRLVASLPKVNIDLDPEPSHFKGDDDLPVDSINYYEAQEFCDRLSKATGEKYRLPTEAEWEYACRAGTTTPFNTGETISTDQANYDGNYTFGKGGVKGEYRQCTTPVGSFKPNGFGLYDMHGNLWEWCSPSKTSARKVNLEDLTNEF